MISWCRVCNENWLQSGYACPCTYRGTMELMTLAEFFALRARRREFNTVDLAELREERDRREFGHCRRGPCYQLYSHQGKC